MVLDRRRSFDRDGQHEDRRDPGSYDLKKSSRRSSYHNDRRLESERRPESHRSSNHHDYPRFDDDQPYDKPPSITSDTRSPLSLANATSSRSNGNSSSLPFATMHHPGAARSPSQRESELKSLVEVLCDKMWWRVQCEQERKKEKKLCADRERCPPGNPETANYSDILRLQIEQCQKAKKKCSDRMNMADDKFMTGIAHLIERYASHTQTPSGAADNDVQKEALDAMLESLRQAVEASFNQRIQEETDRIAASISTKQTATNAIQTKLLKETDDLKKSLNLERQRNDRLEKKLEDMEQKFNSMTQRQDHLARETASTQSSKDMAEACAKMKQLFQRLDWISVNTVSKGELKTALEQFDDVVASALDPSKTGRQETQATPSGSKSRQHLRQLSSAVENIKSSLACDAGSTVPRCVANLQNRVSSCTESIQAQSKQSSKMSETLKTLEHSISSLQSAKPQHKQEHSTPPPPPPQSLGHAVSQEDIDNQMTRLSATLAEDLQGKMQKMVHKVAGELGSFIDNERREREKASNKADMSCKGVESLRQGVDELRNYTHASIHKLDGLSVHILAQMQHQRDGMASFDSRLQHVAIENAASAEEVAMQLRVLNTWQSNFTTKPLYREIVDHITKTLPSGMCQQMSMLTSRVDAVESQLRGGEASMKKRKLQE